MSSGARALPILTLASLAMACGGARAELAGEDAAPPIDGGVDAGASKTPDAAASIDAAGGSDAANGDDAASTCAPPVADSTMCNAVPAAPAMITSTCSTASAPQPTGGKVGDGTYVLESMTYFGTCPAMPDVEADSWTICGTDWDTRQETAVTTGNVGVPPLVQRIDTTASFAGAVVTVSIGCTFPAGTTPGGTVSPSSEVWGYDATPGHLVLHVPVGAGLRVDAYVKN